MIFDKLFARTFLGVTLVIATCGVAYGGDKTVLLSQSCEEALALSALPMRLRDSASVYVLTEDGYKKTISSDGPFTCIVGRNHPQSLIPQCPNRAGAEQIIPGIIFTSLLGIEATAPDEISAKFDERVANGEFLPPTGPGVSWMASPYNYILVGDERIAHVPAHMMYYAPGLTDADIGGSSEEGFGSNRGVPFILDEGPHAYMISVIEHPTDGEQVLQACGDQVPTSPPAIAQSSAAN